MANRITKKDIVNNLLTEIKSNVNALNVDIAIPILNWTSKKINLSQQEKTRQEVYRKSNRTKEKPRLIYKWSIYEANLGKNVGSEQNGTNRPVLVLQNQIFNSDSNTVIIVPLTDILDVNGNQKRLMKTHVEIDHNDLSKKSIIKLEHLKSISKNRLKKYVCSIDNVDKRVEIEEKIKLLIGIKK
ncbi:type II toxin-antitoxin system PemK/MazF family toxin [Pseudobacteroides cellulosolvens]|uniref:Transcriptional modulator of MazE/toxin, MazF n=1 Tax=Pseudobacteroides cellulosolvens ATCC 35603 = DSM 2933 TaxID=398512 RepID=A0A0L6JKK1_9FIRM|nr:type II toxin-antitoxin system PemK/MazF family toxin [Pseudobacteroides cellulosolvens]KNY26309.1 transcriptional modulator of MazE/toxin, MazF [Pseudobacteroides cellulosolvens ATCC 35603 = DSM 2933]